MKSAIKILSPVLFYLGKEHPGLYCVLLILYYFAIILALVLMYGRGDFSTAPFVYQGF